MLENFLVEILKLDLVLISSWFIGISIGTFLLSLVGIPFVIIRLPTDYFVAEFKQRKKTGWRIVMSFLRNALALILFILGVAMLVLPGQGILTIFIAIIISDVPSKYKLERWFIHQEKVFKTLNWIRLKFKKAPLERALNK